MKSKKRTVFVILLMVCILGGLIAFMMYQDASAAPEEKSVSLPTGLISKGTVVDKVTGAAEVKGAVTEKLKMAKWRSFQACVAPLDVKIPAGTPLVEYTKGDSLVAPYDLIIRSKNLPEKKWDSLNEEHYLEVSRIDLLHVELDVHENDIACLAVGQSAQVTFGFDEEKVLLGTIVKVNELGTYDAAGSKYRVTIEVPNDGSVMIGMSANASINVAEAVDVLTVPISAIHDSDEGPFVLLSKSDGSCDSVPVETGLSDGSAVEISGDISEGDTVVLNEVASDTSDMPDADGIIADGSSTFPYSG